MMIMKKMKIWFQIPILSDKKDNNAYLDDKNEDPKDDPRDSDGEKHNKPDNIKDANKKRVKCPKKKCQW